ncbi:MAG: hypothetical protein ACF8XB_03280 [Planctomycetota bacterium JB042]
MRTLFPVGLALAATCSLFPVACSSDAVEAAADEVVGAAKASTDGFDRPGFETFVVDGRLWVFEEGSEGLKEYESTGEPAKSVTMIGKGPNGMTIRSDEKRVIESYMAAY